MDKLKKERIALEVIKILKSDFDNFQIDASDYKANPFHQAFLEAFHIKNENRIVESPFIMSPSSWMHGLNTTLGQSFFENVANILCDGEKRKFTGLSLRNNTRCLFPGTSQKTFLNGFLSLRYH